MHMCYVNIKDFPLHCFRVSLQLSSHYSPFQKHKTKLNKARQGSRLKVKSHQALFLKLQNVQQFIEGNVLKERQYYFTSEGM